MGVCLISTGVIDFMTFWPSCSDGAAAGLLDGSGARLLREPGHQPYPVRSVQEGCYPAGYCHWPGFICPLCRFVVSVMVGASGLFGVVLESGPSSRGVGKARESMTLGKSTGDLWVCRRVSMWIVYDSSLAKYAIPCRAQSRRRGTSSLLRLCARVWCFVIVCPALTRRH